MDWAFISPEQMQAIRDRHEMMAQDQRNRIRSMIDAQTPEHLVVLRDLFQNFAHDANLASYFEGVAGTTLQLKFPDVCEGCGENHDELTHDDLSPESITLEELAEQTIALRPTEDALLDAEGKVNEDMLPEPIQNLNEQMDLFGVEPITDNPLGEVRCKNCGMHYVSLADRMLREPGIEGCGGCIQKEKWG